MPASLAGLIELERPVEVAVVGQGQGVHAQLFGLLDQSFDRAGAVEQAVVAVAVQMNKRLAAHRFLPRFLSMTFFRSLTRDPSLPA